MSLYFVREKFMEFVYERLSSVEAVYKQFAWDLLMENSYALNYFESKLRNSKKYWYKDILSIIILFTDFL